LTAHASQLETAVREAFAERGPLARADANYALRDSQLEMALGVARAIDSRDTLVAEAGTGIGKTWAYLVPVLLSGARALLSTATKGLQDQLFLRDLPKLCHALQVRASVALLKGRSSYLCLHRLAQSRQASLGDRWSERALARVEKWALMTRSGDLAELDGLDERSPVIPLVTSSRENCLGSACPELRTCHVMKARREAMAADVVVVNHHLYFADMALRDGGIGELLPSVEVAVFDEAHQLSETGVQFLGVSVSSAQVIDFARDTLACGLQQARGLVDWQDVAARCDRAARELRIAVGGMSQRAPHAARLRWDERAGQAAFDAALGAIHAACRDAERALETVSELAPDFVRLAERAGELAARAALFAARAEKGCVRWIDASPHQARLVESPLDIREALAEQRRDGGRAWIYTSATLGDDERLSWFSDAAGLAGAATLRAESPFDYAEHARLYVPRAFPKPGEPRHAEAVAALAARCALALGGRSFVLTTTLRALQAIGELLHAVLQERPDPIAVLVQGSASKRTLLRQFLAAPRSVLVASHSFWEGIDVPGDALQCVVIDKLPFPPPNDPLVQARAERIDADGGNAFDAYFVAEAAVSLKQGAGRLIRSETDRGLLVVCDPRMLSMPYGRRLCRALPPMRRLESEVEALDWLRALAGSR